eukprot:1216698-Prymnesium_polylepis.1
MIACGTSSTLVVYIKSNGEITVRSHQPTISYYELIRKAPLAMSLAMWDGADRARVEQIIVLGIVGGQPFLPQLWRVD